MMPFFDTFDDKKTIRPEMIIVVAKRENQWLSYY